MLRRMKSYLFLILTIPQLAFSYNATEPVVETPKQLEWSQFLRNQLTNHKELLTDAFVLAFVDVTFGEYTKILGKNPNAKLIVRDFTKAPGLAANVWQGNEVGGTGYIYDESHFYAHSSKIATKLGFYTFLTKVFGLNPGTAAIVANWPGDSVGRFFIIAGQIRQDLENGQPFASFMWGNFDPKWISDTVYQQLPNLAGMHVLGSLAARYAVGDKIQALALASIGKVVSHDVVAGRTFSENSAQIGSYIGKTRIFIVMVAASAAEKAFFTFVFPPLSRLMMALGSSAASLLPSFGNGPATEKGEL